MPSVRWRPAYTASAAAVMLELSTVAKRGRRRHGRPHGHPVRVEIDQRWWWAMAAAT
eukprot:COSAG01_NODE_561_length_15460_cov_95.444307_21_plen_57_part_00